MELSARQIRAHRLRAHHLDQKYPFGELAAVAGTCGLQNSPPGAWETAAFCRLKKLHSATAAPGAVPEKGTAAGVEHSRRTADLPDGGQRRFPLCASSRRRRGAVDLHQRNRPCARPSGDVLCRAAALGGERSRISGRSHHQKQGGAGPGAGPAGRRTAPGSKAIALERPLDVRRARPADGCGAAVSFLLRPCSFKGLVVFGERGGHLPDLHLPAALAWAQAGSICTRHSRACTPLSARLWACDAAHLCRLARQQAPPRQSGSGGRLRRSLNR